MSSSGRSRLRAAALALSVAASGLALAVAPATAAHASSCVTGLGPAVSIKNHAGIELGVYYLGWDPCASPQSVYSEVHWDDPAGIQGVTSGSWVEITNSSGGSDAWNLWYSGGLHWWGSPKISIYSYPSSDREYQGIVSFGLDGGGTCSGRTITWNFSNGTYINNGGVSCNF